MPTKIVGNRKFYQLPSEMIVSSSRMKIESFGARFGCLCMWTADRRRNHSCWHGINSRLPIASTIQEAIVFFSLKDIVLKELLTSSASDDSCSCPTEWPSRHRNKGNRLHLSSIDKAFPTHLESVVSIEKDPPIFAVVRRVKLPIAALDEKQNAS